MKNNKNFSNYPLNINEITEIFKMLYSLPAYSDQIKDTQGESSERNVKLEELKTRINEIYYRLGKKSESISENIYSSNYAKQVNELKNIFMEDLLQIYPDKPMFFIVNEIYQKLNQKYTPFCEELMMDIANKVKNDTMKKTIRKELKKIFDRYDLDGSGTITLKELEENVSNYGLPTLIAKEIMIHADHSANGEIDFEEFEAYTEQQIIKYYKIFYNLDSDHDMNLNFKQAKQSLHEVFPHLEIDDIFPQLFNTMDKDKSGLISFDEWCEFLILFPSKNLEYMTDQWRLLAFTSMGSQDGGSFVEKDLMGGAGKTLSAKDILITLLFGAISGGVSRTVTAPLEQLRVLYQTMYTKTQTPTVMKGLSQIYNQHGFTSLFRGNSISVVMNMLEQSMRFSIIEYSKTHFEDEFGHIPPHNLLLIGVMTGILSTLILYPMDVIRIRVISTENRENKHKVYNMVKNMYKTTGIKGFYSGLSPHLMVVLPGGSCNVMFYNLMKKLLVTEEDMENPKVGKFMFIGGAAALITGSVTYPFTLLTSRMVLANKNIQNLSEKIRLMTIMKNTYNNEGIFGFFKGYNASILRLIIGQACNFGTYEMLKSNYKKFSKKNQSK